MLLGPLYRHLMGMLHVLLKLEICFVDSAADAARQVVLLQLRVTVASDDVSLHDCLAKVSVGVNRHNVPLQAVLLTKTLVAKSTRIRFQLFVNCLTVTSQV